MQVVFQTSKQDSTRTCSRFFGIGFATIAKNVDLIFMFAGCNRDYRPVCSRSSSLHVILPGTHMFHR